MKSDYDDNELKTMNSEPAFTSIEAMIMKLTVDGELRTFVPIKDFRFQQGLPPEFGVALFEPKDYSGLGSIDRAGTQLNDLQTIVLAAIPSEMPLSVWLGFLPSLVDVFHHNLRVINPQIGLKDVEIDYAVAGFSDVCHALIYGLLRARAVGAALPAFQQIYEDWLDSTIRISSTVYTYDHHGESWLVQIVHHAYGRIGLMITTRLEVFYVQDGKLGCPAEGFMASLLREVAGKIIATAG